MFDAKDIFEEFLFSVLADADINTINIPAEECFNPPLLFDLDKANLAYHQNQDAFLNTYKTVVASFLEVTKNDDSSNVAQHSLVLLKLVDINVSFGLDTQLLADLLIALSNKIELLETTYASHIYGDYFWGTRIGTNVSLMIDHILTRESYRLESNLTQTIIIDAISQIPVTNTTLAAWNYFCLKHYGKKPSKKVTQANKACLLYDRLVGNGMKELLLNNTQEKVEKKLKPFDNVGLQDICEKILAFYSCKTGNEKRRFLSRGIEDFIEYSEMINSLNRFLVD